MDPLISKDLEPGFSLHFDEPNMLMPFDRNNNRAIREKKKGNSEEAVEISTPSISMHARSLAV
jgi:hypothetical protein